MKTGKPGVVIPVAARKTHDCQRTVSIKVCHYVLAFLSTSSLSCVLAQAQMHDMDMPMAVGHVDFSNLCSPSAKFRP
jgi:hypothetical protein